jgi:large subunit ribosomal protein L35
MSKKLKTKSYKLKSNRGATKRFKITGSGKVRFRRAFRNHIKTKKSCKKVRHQRANGVMAPMDAKTVHGMMPYGNS